MADSILLSGEPIRGESEIRRIVPTLNLLKIEEVQSIRVDFSYRREAEHTFQLTDVYITFSYFDEGLTYIITLALIGVRDLKIPTLGNYFQLGELFIFPAQNASVEQVRYGFEDTLDGMVGYSRDVALTRIDRVDSNGVVTQLWQETA